MILSIDRDRKIILLKWLKQGYIDTLDIPEAYQDGNLFYEFLIESSLKDDSLEEKVENED